MSTADPAALDQFISAFTGQVGGGFGAIAGEVQAVLATLVVISITLTAVLWAINETQNVLAPLVRKILLIGFFAWLVTNWHSLSLTVVNGFAKLGLQASGGGSIGDFTKAPTKAVEAGLSIVVDLIKYIGDLAQQNAGFGALMHIDMIIVAAVAAIGILLAFIILAIEIAVTIIEFYIVTLIAFVVVPFGVLSQTSFLAEKAIGYVISVGFKFMALAVIAGIGINIFETYTLSAQPTVAEDAGLLLSAIFLMMLSLKVPSIAGAIISGGPQLNTGSALMGAAGVAAGAAGVGLAGRSIGGAAAGGLAGGGGKVSAARAASGAINSGGSGGGGSPGGGGAPSGSSPPSGGGPGPSSPSASASRAADGGGSSQGSPPPGLPPTDPSPSGASLVTRAQARRGDGLTSAARSTFAAATAAGDSQGPGMSATPTRRDEEPVA